MISVQLDAWGGLAAQLSSFCYALWIVENKDRSVEMAFHTGGTSRRYCEVTDLITSLGPDGRVGVKLIDDWLDPGDPMAQDSRKPRGKGGPRPIMHSLRRRTSELINRSLSVTRIRISEQHIGRRSLQRVMPWTRRIQGYATDWGVVNDVWESFCSVLHYSGRPNFTVEAGGQNFVAVHWRLGDYLLNPLANSYHGAIRLASIFGAIEDLNVDADTVVRFFTDSPSIALDLIEKSNFHYPIEIVSTSIWNDLFDMSRARWFVGSHSAVSAWAAIAVLRGNSSSRVILPNRWFKATSEGHPFPENHHPRLTHYRAEFD